MRKKTVIPLDRATNHCIALGRMMGHWALVEECLSDLLGYFLRVELTRQQLIFSTFVSLSSKIDLLQRLIHCYAFDSPQKTQLLELITKAIKYNSIRNSYVHALWAAGGSKDLLLKFDNRVPKNPRTFKRPSETVTATTIDDFVSELATLSASFLKFQAFDLPKMIVSPQPLQ